jgi:hypothetical protein
MFATHWSGAIAHCKPFHAASGDMSTQERGITLEWRDILSAFVRRYLPALGRELLQRPPSSPLRLSGIHLIVFEPWKARIKIRV